MSYLSLALSIIRLIISLIERYNRQEYINEGARLERAKQIKEINDALVRASGVQKEWRDISDEEVRARFKEEWFTD